MNWFKRKGHKFSAKRSEMNGYSFSSQLERSVYAHLCLLEKAGEVKDIQVQATVSLTLSDVKYIADFLVFDNKLGEPVWIEAKGVETPVWRLKRRLWMNYGPGLLRVYKGKADRFYVFEEIRPKVRKESDV